MDERFGVRLLVIIFLIVLSAWFLLHPCAAGIGTVNQDNSKPALLVA